MSDCENLSIGDRQRYCEACGQKLAGTDIERGICGPCERQGQREAEQDFWDNENPYDYTADL